MLGILRWKEERGGGGAGTLCGVTANQLTLFHHADVDAALETAGLAVAPVVLGDGAAPVERTGEGGFTLHAAPAGREGGGRSRERRGNVMLVHYASGRAEEKETNVSCSRTGTPPKTLGFSSFILRRFRGP